MSKSQIQLDNQIIFNVFHLKIQLALFLSGLSRVKGIPDSHQLLLLITFTEDVLYIVTQFRIIAEKAPDKVVCKELIKMDHLDKIEVKINRKFKVMTILISDCTIETHAQLIYDLIAFFIFDICFELINKL